MGTLKLIIVLTCILLICQFALSAPANNCTAIEIETEAAVQIIIQKYMGKDLEKYIPKKPEDMDETCLEAKSSIKIANKFKKCLKLLPGQVYRIVLKNVKGVIKRVCDDQAGREEFVDFATCFNGGNARKLTEQWNRIVRVLHYLPGLEKNNEIVYSLCCGVAYVKEEIARILGEYCEPSKVDKSVKYAIELIDVVIKEIVDLVCGDLTERKTCEAKQPEIMRNILELTKEPVTLDPYMEKHLIGPLIAIADKLGTLDETDLKLIQS